MDSGVKTLDLRGEAASRVQGLAYAVLRDLQQGDAIALLTAEEPTVLMQSLGLHLRHRLAWTIGRDPGGWRTEVRHSDDGEYRGVTELLSGAHRALDALFVAALRRVNAGDLPGALPILIEFGSMLRRHIHAEDAVVAPLFGVPPVAAGASPVSVMQREHAEILQQLGIIEACFAESAPSDAEVGAFCAILSGTLAKHEHREETNVFPLWRAQLARRTPAERADVFARVAAALKP